MLKKRNICYNLCGLNCNNDCENILIKIINKVGPKPWEIVPKITSFRQNRMYVDEYSNQKILISEKQIKSLSMVRGGTKYDKAQKKVKKWWDKFDNVYEQKTKKCIEFKKNFDLNLYKQNEQKLIDIFYDDVVLGDYNKYYFSTLLKGDILDQKYNCNTKELWSDEKKEWCLKMRIKAV